MKQRILVILILATAAGIVSVAQPKRQKFYITGFLMPKCATENLAKMWEFPPPTVSYGVDRIDALNHCCENGGLTVWTEQEWQYAQETFRKARQK